MNGFRKGQKVMVDPNNDNECYGDFNKKILVITHVARNKQEHPGFDDSLTGQKLYDFELEDGSPVGCSLYDYELIKY